AAHCVAAPADKIQIIFGLKVGTNWSPTSADKVMSITGYTANPNYKGENFQGNDMGDIALIHLSEALPSGYSPVALLPETESLNAGEMTLL
ncbi:trypsin-like serine protease, partial [Pseudomonas sp. FW305-3-2-15-C-TSA2]|uniref:trypsin-like serine protease n=1 Tax=Pseudomonas sp. FW305-3-2-15-C-TSA2 TaxID=2751334 RepID=UPI0011AF74D9